MSGPMHATETTSTRRQVPNNHQEPVTAYPDEPAIPVAHVWAIGTSELRVCLELGAGEGGFGSVV